MFDDDDLEAIREVFLEESNEGLDIMESGLLSLTNGEVDIELINNIFRAAHSIKGGGGTFGFTEVTDFTHGVETLLDQMRDGQRLVVDDLIQLLLESVDCLRGMMDTIGSGSEYDTPRIAELQSRIEAMLATPGIPDESSDAVAETPPAAAESGSSDTENPVQVEAEQPSKVWEISFTASASFLEAGNEPQLIFQALGTLGELNVVADCHNVADMREGDNTPQAQTWHMTLKTHIDKKAIEEIFAWAEDSCELSIQESQDIPPSDLPLEVAVATTAPASEDNTKSSGMKTFDAFQVIQDETAAKAEPQKNAPKKAPNAAAKPAANKEAGSIRVSIDKVDALLNLVGELVITQSMLGRFNRGVYEHELDDLRDSLAQLEHNTRELQESAMQIRMLPIKVSFSRFSRLVRDLSKTLNKKVRLEVSGENTELDKTVLEKIGDPLVHLVRNSLDHGIEKPEDRIAAGKPEEGLVSLSAFHQAGNIVIEIKDDGAGLNKDRILEKAKQKGLLAEDEQPSEKRIYNLIFQAGFSTAEVVSDVSGRGVGMDVVRRNIEDLGGRIEVTSEAGVGSTFSIRLPLTLAILDGQLVRVGEDIYIIPLLSIVETVLIESDRVNSIANNSLIYRLREDILPILDLCSVFTGKPMTTQKDTSHLEGKLLMVVESGNRRYGVVVDELRAQQQVVIKALETNYRNVNGLAGATILGDGMVALILDVPGLVQRCFSDQPGERTSEAA